jgi:hypothetical protein
VVQEGSEGLVGHPDRFPEHLVFGGTLFGRFEQRDEDISLGRQRIA